MAPARCESPRRERGGKLHRHLGEGLLEAGAHRQPQIRQQFPQRRCRALHIVQLLPQMGLLGHFPLEVSDGVVPDIPDAAQSLTQAGDLALPLRLRRIEGDHLQVQHLVSFGEIEVLPDAGSKRLPLLLRALPGEPGVVPLAIPLN